METIIFSALLGIFIIVFGGFNLKGHVSFLHRQWLTEKTVKAYGRLLGTGTILSGGSLMGFGACSFLAEQLGSDQIYLAGGVILLAGFATGLVMSLYALIRYNKSIL